MTEKRFILNEGVANFSDTVTDKIYSEYNLDEIVRLLNEYDKKYNEYRKDVLRLEEELDYYKTKCSSLEKRLFQQDREIAKLKKENNELQLIKQFAENNGINVFNIDEAFRKCWDDNAELVNENRKLIQIIDEADDLIKSHLSSHYNRKWENYCKNKGFNLKELEL